MPFQRLLVPSSGGFSLPMDAYIPEITDQIDADVCRPTVVIFPGGGYVRLSAREAEPVALNFAAAGFNAFVVWNRVAPHRYPLPQQDAAAAVAYIRAHAAETHSDPNAIAVLGFSAGAHVAGSLAVLWPQEELWASMGLTPAQVQPNAAVLCYPVITAGEHAHRGSFEALTGSSDIAEHLPYSLETKVTAKTPPTFLWHTWDDAAVPVENTLLFAAALKAHGVRAEVHIFPHGDHGSALCVPQTSGPKNARFNLPDCAEWPRLAQHFLAGQCPAPIVAHG